MCEVSLWQARFYSCPLSDAHLWEALAYVERNPVRAHLVVSAEQYEWSSARQRLGLCAVAGPTLHVDRWAERWSAEQWRTALATSLGEESFARRIQEATMLGRPLVSKDRLVHLATNEERSMYASQKG